MCHRRKKSESGPAIRGRSPLTPLPPARHAGGDSFKPDWQAERAARLQRACLSVQTRTGHGEPRVKAFRRVSKYHNGRVFKCDPSRRLRLAEKTLWRVFAMWKRAGEIPAAFKLNFRKRQPSITAPVLLRFNNFCVTIRQPFLKTAWDKFAARNGSFGRGRYARARLKISYGQLRYYFPAADFKLLQGELKAIAVAQTRFAQLRLRIAEDIRRRLPDRLPRRRVKRQIDFSI